MTREKLHWKWNHPRQLQTDSMFTYDKEGLDCRREEIYNSLESRGLFPEEQSGCHKETRGTDEHHQRGKDKAGKCSYGMDRQQKSLW